MDEPKVVAVWPLHAVTDLELKCKVVTKTDKFLVFYEDGSKEVHEVGFHEGRYVGYSLPVH